jgi:hypothetical protein
MNFAAELRTQCTYYRFYGISAVNVLTLVDLSVDTEGGSSRFVEKDLQTLTVQKLKAMLKEKGLPLKGIKVMSHAVVYEICYCFALEWAHRRLIYRGFQY